MILINQFKKIFQTNNFFQILCCYTNQTRKIQLVKITNNYNNNWQQVVLPGQCFSFEALFESELEIYADQNHTSIIDVIPCAKLAVIPIK